MSDAMSDCPKSIAGVIALATLVLSFLIPGWVAGALGLSGPHAHLLAWLATQGDWVRAGLWLVYGLAGFGMLLAGVMAVVAAGFLLTQGLLNVMAWAVRTSGATALLLGQLMFWPLEILAELLRDLLEEATSYLTARWHERRELRRLYREDFAADFPTFRAFLRFYRAVGNGEDPEEDDTWGKGKRSDGSAPEFDPFKAAIRLLGLPEGFTRDDLKRRFGTLIKGVHPDLVGPNELAPQVNNAYALIKERKGWT
jgi:hypothetical protein